MITNLCRQFRGTWRTRHVHTSNHEKWLGVRRVGSEERLAEIVSKKEWKIVTGGRVARISRHSPRRGTRDVLLSCLKHEMSGWFDFIATELEISIFLLHWIEGIWRIYQATRYVNCLFAEDVIESITRTSLRKEKLHSDAGSLVKVISNSVQDEPKCI